MEKTLLSELSRLQKESTNPKKDLLIGAVQSLDAARRMLQIYYQDTLPPVDAPLNELANNLKEPLFNVIEAIYDIIVDLDEHVFENNEDDIKHFFRLIQ